MLYNDVMVTRQRIIFQGRVQGVGFRVRSRSIANRYSVTGWVRNEPDGTVMLEAQADEETLGGFLSELRKKTSGLVEREIHANVRTEPNESTFEIHRNIAC
jgi:acylphosphatase